MQNSMDVLYDLGQDGGNRRPTCAVPAGDEKFDFAICLFVTRPSPFRAVMLMTTVSPLRPQN